MNAIDGWDGPIHPAADVFPLTTGDEFDSLVASIVASGLREACWLNPDGVLLDGRNRIRACHAAGIKPRFRTYKGDDPVTFIVDLNRERRQLTTGQAAMLALELEPLYAEQAKLNVGGRPKAEPKAKSEPGQPAPQAKPTADRQQVSRNARTAATKAGKAAKVSGRSVAKAKRVKAAAPDLAEKVQSGAIALDRADRILRDREAEAKRVAAAKAAREATPDQTRVDIRHGDFREVLADLVDVDAIITDPPYPAEYLDLLDDLAAWSDKVLKPDGVLAVLFGQTHLPEVYRRLDGHRPYRWTMAYLTPGAGYVSHPRKVQSNWKPVLIYGGGPRLADVLRTEAQDAGAKDMHEWGQDYGAFHVLVQRLCQPGQVVADPFAGSGTTLLAAVANGCHAVGCDVNAEHVETMRRRLS